MATQVTLDDDLATLLAQEAARSGLALDDVANRLIRQGFRGSTATLETSGGERFHTRTHAFGLRPGYDRDRMNQLLDDLDIEEVQARLHDPR